MRPNHKPCPICGAEMNRQSRMCRACYFKKQATPEERERLSLARIGKPSYERTPEHRQRMSDAQKGKPKLAARGKKRPEAAKHIAQAWTPEMREAARLRGLINAENREWLVKIADALSGENNPNFQGKGQETPYAPGWGRRYRERIRARAAGICERCRKLSERPLDLHHMDFGKANHDPSNLVVVCRACHKALHAEHLANSANT